MKVKIEAVGFTPKQELLDFVQEKAGKLFQFYDRIINVEATLNVENSDTKENKVCGIRLIIPGNDLWASAQCKTFEEATAQTVDALEKQLDKRKTTGQKKDQNTQQADRKQTARIKETRYKMFYEELYPELGKLFYWVAAADGNIKEAEKATLLRLIRENWKPLEDSTDEFGMDKANLIDFAFEFAETEENSDNYIQSFENFYRLNKSYFTPALINNILQTSKSIAKAYRGENKKEKEIQAQLVNLFEN